MKPKIKLRMSNIKRPGQDHLFYAKIGYADFLRLHRLFNVQRSRYTPSKIRAFYLVGIGR
jgi:hypothetical protein